MLYVYIVAIRKKALIMKSLRFYLYMIQNIILALLMGFIWEPWLPPKYGGLLESYAFGFLTLIIIFFITQSNNKNMRVASCFILAIGSAIATYVFFPIVVIKSGFLADSNSLNLHHVSLSILIFLIMLFINFSAKDDSKLSV